MTAACGRNFPGRADERQRRGRAPLSSGTTGSDGGRPGSTVGQNRRPPWRYALAIDRARTSNGTTRVLNFGRVAQGEGKRGGGHCRPALTSSNVVGPALVKRVRGRQILVLVTWVLPAYAGGSHRYQRQGGLVVVGHSTAVPWLCSFNRSTVGVMACRAVHTTRHPDPEPHALGRQRTAALTGPRGSVSAIQACPVKLARRGRVESFVF